MPRARRSRISAPPAATCTTTSCAHVLRVRGRGRAVSGDTPRRFLVEHLSDFPLPRAGAGQPHGVAPAARARMAGRRSPPSPSRYDPGRCRPIAFSGRLRQRLPPVQRPSRARVHSRALAVGRRDRARARSAGSHGDLTPGTRWRRPQRRLITSSSWRRAASLARVLRSKPLPRPRRLRRGDDPIASLLEMSHALHTAFRYEPGSTAVDSPIEHILETGSGVCQDYTHVMIAIARAWGVPEPLRLGLHPSGGRARRADAGGGEPRLGGVPAPRPRLARHRSRPTTPSPTTAMSASPWAATTPMRRRRGARCSVAENPGSTCA